MQTFIVLTGHGGGKLSLLPFPALTAAPFFLRAERRPCMHRRRRTFSASMRPTSASCHSQRTMSGSTLATYRAAWS